MTSQAGVKNLKVPWRGPCEESLSTSDATTWLAFMRSSANLTHSARSRPTSVLTGGGIQVTQILLFTPTRSARLRVVAQPRQQS